MESNVKKGLLGTAIQAWQHNIQSKQDREILIVPCTMTSSLVLEAETLIDDALAEQGKSRYIITDDEFSERRTVANFARKVLHLDSSIYVRFSMPFDCIGNPVDANGISRDPNGVAINRKEYVCDDDGQVIFDPQRDQQYTKRLARAITKQFIKDSIVVPTHLVAKAAWMTLQRHHPHLDTYQLALLSTSERTIATNDLIAMVNHLTTQIKERNVAHVLPPTLEKILEIAYQRFSLFHKEQAVVQQGQHLIINAKLAYYYGNRLAHLNLKTMESPS